MASQSPISFSKQVEESEAVVFSTVLFYSLLILLAPLGTFLVTQLTFNGIIGTDSQTSNIWAAVLAVIVLHVMLGLFIYRTFVPAAKQIKRD